MSSLACAFFSYLIGSFPTAFLLGKRLKKIDIRQAGTGNVGALNAYEVTGSATFGLIVATVDISKGVAATLLFGGGMIFSNNLGQASMMLAAMSVVTGHNYSVFIGFKGGRGLATAAGAFLVAQPLAIALFLAVYFLLRLLRAQLYLSSVIGILTGFVPVFWKLAPTFVSGLLASILLFVLLSKQISPLKNEIRNQTVHAH